MGVQKKVQHKENWVLGAAFSSLAAAFSVSSLCVPQKKVQHKENWVLGAAFSSLAAAFSVSSLCVLQKKIQHKENWVLGAAFLPWRRPSPSARCVSFKKRYSIRKIGSW